MDNAGPSGEVNTATPAGTHPGTSGSGAGTAEPGSPSVLPQARADATGSASDSGVSGAAATAGEERVVIRDNRKIDVSDGKAGVARTQDVTGAEPGGGTGEARPAADNGAGAGGAGTVHAEPAADAAPAGADPVETGPAPLGAELEALRGELDERTKDLQRVSAEYANYRKRVERDRGVVIDQATGVVLVALLPVLDDLDRAREHGDLVGPFGAVAEQLTGALAKFGLTAFGAKGDRFDPTRHEAVAHTTSSEVTEPTCVDVMRRGYLLGERLLRPALVAVADPADR